MFGLAYLILLVVAAIPLAATVLRHRSDPPSAALVHRVYRDLAYIALAALAIVAFEVIAASRWKATGSPSSASLIATG